MKRLLSALCLIGLLSACQVLPGEDPETGSGSVGERKLTTIEEQTADWLRYGNENSKVTFLYPPDWQVQVNEAQKQIIADFGKGERIVFAVSEIPIPHKDLSVIAKQDAGEKWHYNKYLSKGKYFYNVFKEFNPAVGRTYMKGTVYYSHIYAPSGKQSDIPASQVDFKMEALDIEFFEPKDILMEAKYKNFWYILHTLHLN